MLFGPQAIDRRLLQARLLGVRSFCGPSEVVAALQSGPTRAVSYELETGRTR